MYTHEHWHAYTHMHLCIGMYMQRCAHIGIHSHMQTHIRTYRGIFKHRQVHTSVHVYIKCFHVTTYTQRNTFMHTNTGMHSKQTSTSRRGHREKASFSSFSTRDGLTTDWWLKATQSLNTGPALWLCHNRPENQKRKTSICQGAGMSAGLS